jgi:hypothetical protein
VFTRSGIVIALILATASQARAHKLHVDYRAEGGGRVRVESWYDTGDSPTHGKVTVHKSDGALLAEGVLDTAGFFVFRVTAAEDLQVVVNDGAGHRAEVKVPAKALSASLLSPEVGTATACLTPPTPPALPLAVVVVALAHTHPDEKTPRSSEDATPATAERAGSGKPDAVPVRDLLTGVGFLLALAAFLMSVRNARTLRELKAGGK